MWLSQSLYTTFSIDFSIVTTTSSRITTPSTTHLLFHIPWLVNKISLITQIKNLFFFFFFFCNNNMFDLFGAASNATFLENLILCVIAGVPLIGSCLLGVGSISLIYGYAIMFDFMRCLGHCNVEIFSHKLFETLPVLRYLIYTPTYVVDVLLNPLLLSFHMSIIFAVFGILVRSIGYTPHRSCNKGSNFIHWIRNTQTWLCHILL